MDEILNSLAPLLGVVIGAGLTSLTGRRTALRQTFEDARVAVSYAYSAHELYRSDGFNGVKDPEMSKRLLGTMVDERNRALLEARKALSRISPYNPELRDSATRVNALSEAEHMFHVLKTIDETEKAALRSFRIFLR